MVKINIVYKITDNPTGGGNQFLRNLKKWLVEHEYYAEAKEADVILFNSHQFINEVLELKKQYPDKLFIHRVAGPIKLLTYRGDKRDNIVHVANRYLGDATVFQSYYSMNENIKLKMPRNKFEKIIGNAADANVFNAVNKQSFGTSEKVRLVATSWSNNMNKGFHIYEYLDRNLDFNKYEMVFIGNSPVQFQNIRIIAPLNSQCLADELRQQDIYIAACKNEACSNALIEALSCGLPAVCLNSGSNPELLKQGGRLFDKSDDLCDEIDKVAEHYDEYRDKIELSTMDDVALKYVKLSQELVDNFNLGLYFPKKIRKYEEIKIKAVMRYTQCCDKLRYYIIHFKDR